MTTVDDIRESRKDGYWGSPVDAYECIEAEAHVDALLLVIERLEREAAAGRALAAGLRVIGKHWIVSPLLKAYAKAVQP